MGSCKRLGILHLLSLAVTLLVSGACAAEPPLESRLIYLDGKAVQLGDWVAGCDNLGRCTAIGVAPEHPVLGFDASSYMNMVSRVTLHESARAPYELEFWPREDGAHAARKNDYPGPFFVKGLDPDRGQYFTFYNSRITAPPEAAFEMIREMERRRPLWGIDPDTGLTKVRFAVSGFAELWAEMEKAREKAIIIDEYSARTITDYEILPIKSLPLGGFHKKLLTKDICTDAPGPEHITRYRINPKTEMYALECPTETGIGATSHLFERNIKTGSFSEMEFPLGKGSIRNSARDGLSNVWIDQRGRTLEAIEYSSATRDCGTRWLWANSEAGWELLERQTMPVCWGIASADWISTYRYPYREIP